MKEEEAQVSGDAPMDGVRKKEKWTASPLTNGKGAWKGLVDLCGRLRARLDFPTDFTEAKTKGYGRNKYETIALCRRYLRYNLRFTILVAFSFDWRWQWYSHARVFNTCCVRIDHSQTTNVRVWDMSDKLSICRIHEKLMKRQTVQARYRIYRICAIG